MTPQEFATVYINEADAVNAGTGIDPTALLVQWGVETGWGNAVNNQNNLGNIRCLAGVPCVAGFAQFPSLASFCDNAVATWHNGFYGPVLATAGQPIEQQLIAIGQSPWDAGHYDNGGGPGSSLLAALQLIRTGGIFMALSDEAQQNLVFRVADIHKMLIDSASASPESYPGNTLPFPPMFAPLAAELKAIADAIVKLDDIAVIKSNIQSFVLPQLSDIQTKLGALSTSAGGGLTADQAKLLSDTAAAVTRIETSLKAA